MSRPKSMIPIIVNMTPAQKNELDRLAKLLGRKRADLVREGISILIGTYNDVLQPK